MKNALIAVRQLDRQLLSPNENGYIMPKEGWVRTLRKALGMTIKQLANRLGVDPSRVVKIETSEIEKAVTLKTLESVAEALNCRLVYAFVPKTSLEKTIKNQAEKIAKAHLKITAHTMDLESHTIDETWLEEQKKDLTDELLRKSWKHLWEK